MLISMYIKVKKQKKKFFKTEYYSTTNLNTFLFYLCTTILVFQKYVLNTAENTIIL